MEIALDSELKGVVLDEGWHEKYNKICSPVWKEIGELSRAKRMQMECVLGDKIDDIGDQMTLQQFIECVEGGGFIDYDGSGTYVKDGKLTNITILPSDIKHGAIRKEFREIVWYNR